MRARSLVIFDVFNTLVTTEPGSERTFYTGLLEAGLAVSDQVFAGLQSASEGLDHSAWSGSREVYTQWAADTLAGIGKADDPMEHSLAARVIPALEQWHQAPMVALPGAEDCLADFKAAGYIVAVCSNWGWDLVADLQVTGLAASIDLFVTSAQAGYRKPHPQIYHSALELAGFSADEAVFVGDGLRTDALGPQRVGIRSVLLARSASERLHREQVASLSAVVSLLLALGRAPLRTDPGRGGSGNRRGCSSAELSNLYSN